MTNLKTNTNKFYNNNPQLRNAGYIHNYTHAELVELAKCEQDIIYFAEKYVMVTTVDDGMMLVKLREYQKKFLRQCAENQKVVAMWSRRSGKGAVVAIFFLWYTLFNEHKTAAVLANKLAVAKETMEKFKVGFENLPFFLQSGVALYNRTEVVFENRSRFIVGGTTSNAVRGFTINCLALDELAFVHPNIAEEFFTSVFPTISSGKTTKIIVTSTPNGMGNLFYKLFTQAEQNINGFAHSKVTWREVGIWDQAWADEQVKTLGDVKFNQEYECAFLGSKYTLINSNVIQNMVAAIPLKRDEHFTVYLNPEKGRRYFISCDPSRGTGNDFSAFVVLDVTEYPIRIAATYNCNTISPLLLPSIIEQTARSYGDAFVLVEINDNGQQVADILYRDLEYENVVSLSFHGNELGVRTTTSVKRVGCSNFKDIVENQKMIIDDMELIAQVSTFVRDKKSFAAEPGNHDDLVMACVIFSWFMTTQMFVDLNDMNIISAIREKNMQAIEDELTPFGFFDNGLNDEDEIIYIEPTKGLRYLE